MFKRHIFIFSLFLFLMLSIRLNAQYIFYELSEKFKNIHRLIIHDTTRVLVGTDEGIFMWKGYPDLDWPLVDPNFTFPINDLIELDENRIIVLTGNSVITNAVYLGVYNRNLNTYNFTKINKEKMEESPLSIAYNKLEKKIFITAWHKVYFAYEKNGNFDNLHEIGSIPFFFDSNCNNCKLQWFGSDGPVLGGSYKELTGNYIKIEKDSTISSIQRIPVTSIDYNYNTSEVYLSTFDSKVYAVNLNDPGSLRDLNCPISDSPIFLKYGGNRYLEVKFGGDLLLVSNNREIYVYRDNKWTYFGMIEDEIKIESINIWTDSLLPVSPYGIIVCTKDQVLFLYRTESIDNGEIENSLTNLDVCYNRVELNFSVQVPGKISINLFSVLGQKVKVLYNGYCLPGKHHLKLDKNIKCGTYIVRFQNENVSVCKKIFIL